MSEKEREVAENLGASIQKLNEPQMERLTWIAEGMAMEAARREKEGLK